MVTTIPTQSMRFLTIPDVAEELNTSTSTVRRLIAAGTLPATRLGTSPQRGQMIRVRACDLERFIADREADNR